MAGNGGKYGERTLGRPASSSGRTLQCLKGLIQSVALGDKQGDDLFGLHTTLF